MKRIIFNCLMACCIVWQSQAQETVKKENTNWQGPQTLQILNAAPVSLIPFPQKVEWSKEKYVLKPNTCIAYFENDAQDVKNVILSLQEATAKYGISSVLKVLKTGAILPKDVIVLNINKGLGKHQPMKYHLQMKNFIGRENHLLFH